MGHGLCRASRQEPVKLVEPYADIEKNSPKFNAHKKREARTIHKLEKKLSRQPKLEITRFKKELSIDIKPEFYFFGEASYYSDSRQRVQSGLSAPNQLPPSQIQGSATPSVSNDPSVAGSSPAAQETDPALWDEVFCDEIEFLEEVFHDRCFRSLINEAERAEMVDRVRDYVSYNESWGFSSPEKKHKFVTNVLLLCKAYLPRGEGQPSLQKASWNLDKQSSYIDCKITSSVLWRWWTDYIEEVSLRYSSLISWGHRGEGVELLVSKLLEDCDFSKDLINQMKPDVAQKIWNEYEAELGQVKGNLNLTFETICPSKGEENPQDFVNNYIKRSFIPTMLGILAEVYWFINNHPLVIKFRSESEWASANRINNTQMESPKESHFYDSKTNTYLSRTYTPKSISEMIQSYNDFPFTATDGHSGLAVVSNTSISNGNNVSDCQSYPNKGSSRPEEEENEDVFITMGYGTVETIDFSKIYSCSEPECKIKIALKDVLVQVTE